MGKIRINELARELEVKSNVVIDFLVGLGIQDKKSHSSALDDDLADRVRAHVRAGGGAAVEKAEEDAPAAATPAPPAAETSPFPAGFDLKKLTELKADAPPMTRSIADIKAAARRAV